jgi:uncharacterized protein
MTISLLIIPILSFALAQLIKTVVFWHHDKDLRVSNFFTDGGMPSAHSATMSSLTTMIFLTEGLTSTFFVALFVSMVVFRDAYGVRLETSKQAILINKMIKSLKMSHEKALKELVGHTKTQTFFGVILGIAVAVVAHALM